VIRGIDSLILFEYDINQLHEFKRCKVLRSSGDSGLAASSLAR
jgi:hypothetical protein